MLFLHRLHELITDLKEMAIGAVKKSRQKHPAPPFLFTGSLTVEAALALPLCLGVLFLLSGLLFAARTTEQLDHYLCQTARRMAAYSEAGDGVSTVDAYRLFYTELGSSGIDFSGISGGKAGILLSLPEGNRKDGVICLKAACRIRVPGYLTGDKGIRITDKVYTRCWTGEKDGGSNATENAVYVPVFVTENAAVYHKNRSCTYLDLDVRTVSGANVRLIHNQYGESYHACAFCGGGSPGGKCYVTGMGSAWHTDPHCSGLTRHLHTMDEQEAIDSGLKPCSRCGR